MSQYLILHKIPYHLLTGKQSTEAGMGFAAVSQQQPRLPPLPLRITKPHLALKRSPDFPLKTESLLSISV